MPEPTARGIDVSKEEEQYLRSAFRRFALPYVLLFAVLAWATTSWLANDPPAGSPEEVASLRDKVAALEQTVAKLDGRMTKVGSELERAGSRVGALEGRKPAVERASSDDTAALERSLREATRRIAELERRGGSGATPTERIDGLMARMQRLESAARSQSPAAAPTPAPVPAAPAPMPAPAPAPAP
jgi:BMFP domain-containing protein YqiC